MKDFFSPFILMRACVHAKTRTLLAFYGQCQCHPQMVIHMHERSFTSGSEDEELAFTYAVVSKHTLWMRRFYVAPPPTPSRFLPSPTPPTQKGALRLCGSSYDSFTPLHLNNWSPWEAPGPPYGCICLFTLFLCHLFSTLFISINGKPTTLLILILSRNALELLTFAFLRL